MKAEDLLRKYTDGRRARGVCLLSKLQSRAVADAVYREQRLQVRADCGTDVGPFTVRTMGAAFSRNRNGGVLHVTHRAEAAAAQQEAATTQRRTIRAQVAQALAANPAGTAAGDAYRAALAKVPDMADLLEGGQP